MTTAESRTESVYTCPDGTPFPVWWPDEESRKFGWRWDQMHNPLPFTPLSEEMAEDTFDGFVRGMDITGAPAHPVRPMQAHGYRFTRVVPFDDDPNVRRAVAQRDAALRAPRLLELWSKDYLPECEALTRSILGWDDPRWNLKQALDRFEEVRAARRRHGELHTIAMGLTTRLANDLIAFCAREFGGDGEILAGELMTGYPNRSLDSANALWELSRAALALPAVAALLRARPAGEVLAALPGTEGGPEFLNSLGVFLEEYGHRNEAFVELVYRRWIEEPRFPLLICRRYLDLAESSSPRAIHEAQAARREARTAECLAKLTPDKRSEFLELVRLAGYRTVLIEDHNFAIDQKGVSAGRVPCLALGRRLAAQGSIQSADDVFYLYLSDIRRAAADSSLNLRVLVEERRAERTRWMRVLPPTHIGEAPPASNAAMDTFFGKFKTEPDPPGMVIGIAGSPGLIRGTARFVHDLSEADRLQPGEILVTYSTAPPWTPLFAIAGGIVTDSGGVISHCAVVAREYGIPAVVGTRNGTASIRDGMTITVDGTAGTVTLEP